MVTARTPRSLNVVPEILGWAEHKDLTKQLKYYGIFSLVEGFAVLAVMLLLNVRSGSYIVCLLGLTFCIISLRSVWIAYLSWMYWLSKGVDINGAIHQVQQTRCAPILWLSFWVKVCSTLFLMAWYSIMALLIFPDSKGNEIAASSVAGMFFLLVLCHIYIAWSQSEGAQLDWLQENRDGADLRMRELRKMYQKGQISLLQYSVIRSENANASPMCVVCLEEFGENDEVCKLPCGHVFHATCSHLWIREHWNCPLRCDIGLPEYPAKVEVHPTAAATDFEPEAFQISIINAELGMLNIFSIPGAEFV